MSEMKMRLSEDGVPCIPEGFRPLVLKEIILESDYHAWRGTRQWHRCKGLKRTNSCIGLKMHDGQLGWYIREDTKQYKAR